jgi:hypothetical protein
MLLSLQLARVLANHRSSRVRTFRGKSTGKGQNAKAKSNGKPMLGVCCLARRRRLVYLLSKQFFQHQFDGASRILRMTGQFLGTRRMDRLLNGRLKLSCLKRPAETWRKGLNTQGIEHVHPHELSSIHQLNSPFGYHAQSNTRVLSFHFPRSPQFEVEARVDSLIFNSVGNRMA